VREALFNVLGGTVQGCAVLDVYAGSGALGIEALSRGARRAVFVEMASSAAAVVRENLASLSVTDPTVAQVVQRAVERSLDALRTLGPFDLCLIDPPFAAVRDGTALRAVELVAAGGVLSADATVVLEFPSDQPDPSLQGLALQDLRHYGDTRLAFFRPTAAPGNNGLGDHA
jgi:16S rRNA (guanine966-N2)-methyltransferase